MVRHGEDQRRHLGHGRASPSGPPGRVPEPPPPPSRLRTRILPRSVLGIASLILAFAVGAGFSGVVLYSYYQYKLNQTNERVNTLVSGYKKQFANAEGDLAAAAAAAKANIQSQLKTIEQLQASPATLAALVKQVAPTVFFVHTLDVNGQASVGIGLRGDVQQHAVAAAYLLHDRAGGHPIARPGRVHPPGQHRHAGDRPGLGPAIRPGPAGGPSGELARLAGGADHPGPAAGRPDLRRIRIGFGGGVHRPGLGHRRVRQRHNRGRRHRHRLPGRARSSTRPARWSRWRRAPMRPSGFTSDGVWFAPYVEAACNKVLVCPGGTLVGAH